MPAFRSAHSAVRGRRLAVSPSLAVLADRSSPPAAAAATPSPVHRRPTPPARSLPAATATASAVRVRSPARPFPSTLTDDEGTTVELAAEPQKIVSLTPAETETLFAIGAGDRIVGKVEDIANFPPEAAAIPVVGDVRRRRRREDRRRSAPTS